MSQKNDFLFLMGRFRNGTATRRDAERLWDILKGRTSKFALPEDYMKDGEDDESDND